MSAATNWKPCRSAFPSWPAFLDPGAWGREFTSAMDDYPNMAGMWIVGEDMPQESNRVTLSRRSRTSTGLPVAEVHFDDHPNDVAMRNHAYGQGRRCTRRWARSRTLPTPPYPSTHNLGTNRMSANPRDGVVNKWGQTHDIKNLFISDGSQFTTGGAENPTLTIVTLAIRQAEYHGRPDERAGDLTRLSRAARDRPIHGASRALVNRRLLSAARAATRETGLARRRTTFCRRERTFPDRRSPAGRRHRRW